jgi:hypothetical protein
MMTQHGPVIIDWMTAKHGNAMADVARTALLIGNGAPINDMPGGRFLALARRVGCWWYLREYARYGKHDAKQYQRWLPVMAAARLNENIPGESDWLLRLVEAGVRKVESKTTRTVQSDQ